MGLRGARSGGENRDQKVSFTFDAFPKPHFFGTGSMGISYANRHTCSKPNIQAPRRWQIFAFPGGIGARCRCEIGAQAKSTLVGFVAFGLLPTFLPMRATTQGVLSHGIHDRTTFVCQPIVILILGGGCVVGKQQRTRSTTSWRTAHPTLHHPKLHLRSTVAIHLSTLYSTSQLLNLCNTSGVRGLYL